MAQQRTGSVRVIASSSPPERPATQRSTAARRGASRALVVDDDRSCRLVASAMIARLGFSVTAAVDGPNALSLMDTHEPFTLVLMDYMMPDMDGPMTTRLIRQRDEYCDVPIIALTARISARDRDICLDAGMNEYLSKPIVMNQLRAVVERLCC